MLADGPQLAALLLTLERGQVDARAVALLGERLRTWREGPLLRLTAPAYRRAKRDVLLAALALTLAPHAGPATRARRVATFLRRCDCAALGRYSTPAERLAAELHALGEPVPAPRQLQNVLRSNSAIDAAADFLLALT